MKINITPAMKADKPELHGMETKNLRARITDNIKRLHPDVDFMDLAQRAYPASTKDIAFF